MFKETLDLIKGMVTFMRSRSNIAGTAIVAASLMSGVSFADYDLANTGSISIAGTGAAANAGATDAATADLLEMKAPGNLTFSTPSNAGGAALTSLDMEGNAGVITVGPVAITNIFQSPGGETSKIILSANNSVFPTNVFSTAHGAGSNTDATNIHADLSVVSSNTDPLSVPVYVSQLNVTAANTNDITLLAPNPTLKLTNTLNPGNTNGLKMNGGTVEVAANTADMVPPVADFDAGGAYAAKTLKFSAAHNADPLNGVSGLDFSSYNNVFDTIELAAAASFANEDITLHSSQALEISANIVAPSGANKIVTGTATPTIKITGPAPTLQSIPGVLQEPAGTVITTATLDIGASLTNALDLSSKGVYSTVDITSSGNTTGLTLPTGATLKLSQTYLPADAGLKMNGGTVDVRLASTANIVPAVAKFDVNSPYNTKKTLKFSVAHDASPLSGVSGLNFTTYNTVFDTIELAHNGNFAAQDITLDENQTLAISNTITVPDSANTKFVTFAAPSGNPSAIKPAIKISGASVQAVNIPKILKADVGGTVSDVVDGNASLEIGVSLTNALDLSNSTDFDKYGTVILSGANSTTLSGMPTATANLKITGAFAPTTAATITATNKVEVTGQSNYLVNVHKLAELDNDFTVTGGHGHLVLSDNGATSNLKDALAGQTLGLDAAGNGTAEFRTLEVKDTFAAPASPNAFKLGKNATLILNNATLTSAAVKFESGVDYPVVKLKADAGNFGASGSSHGINLQPNAAGDEFDLVVDGSSSTQEFHFDLDASSAPHIHKLVLDGGVLYGNIGSAANPMTGIIEFDGGSVASGSKIHAVNSTVEMKNQLTSGETAIGDIEGSNNTLSLGANQQLGTFAASGFESSSSQPFVFSSFSGLDTAGGKLTNNSYLKLTSTASDAALDTLTETASYVSGDKVALHLDDTNLVLGGKTLPDEIDAILVENGHNTSAGGAVLNLQMTSPTARTIWNAQFKYTDPTATRVSPTFTGQNNAVHVSGLQPGTEVYRSNSAGNALAFYDVPGDFVIRAQSNSSANAWTVCTNATCTATAGGSKIFTLTTAEHGVDGYLSFSEESQALVDTRYEFLGSKVASIVNRSSGDNGFTKYGFRSTRAASSKAPKYSALTSGMSYKTDMSNMVSVAKGVKSTVGIEFTHGKVIDAKNLAFGTYVAMDKDLMPTVAVGGVYNMNYETLIRSNIPTGATTIGSHDKDVAHFFTHTANLHATKSDILKFAGHSLGARLNFNALFTPKFVSSGVTYHKNDLYQVVPELTLDMKLGMLGLNGKLTGAYYSYLGDFKQEISITNGTNTVTEKYEIDGKTGVFAQLELDKSISKHAKLSVNGTLGEHKLYSLGLALKVEA